MFYRLFLVAASIAMTVTYALAPDGAWAYRPESMRLMFFHVPPAMLCSLFFLWGAIQGGIHLFKGTQQSDHRGLAAIEVGTLLCLLATVTGSFFAYAQWDKFWDWDPRQTSIFLQLMVYAAYFAIRASVTDGQRQARISAAYSIFAFVTVPFLIWILPRIMGAFSQHEQANSVVTKGHMDRTYSIIFWSSTLVVLLVSAWVCRMRETLHKLNSLSFEGVNDDDPNAHDFGADTSVVRPVRLRDTNSHTD